MGALTNNRKRGDDYYKSLVSVSPPIDELYGRISKKPKISASVNQITPENTLPASPNSVVSRISQYPERKSGFSREVHAPVRNSRFRPFSSSKYTGITGSSSDSLGDKMGNFSEKLRWMRYEKTRDEAIRSLRYGSDGKQKEKEVVKANSEYNNRVDVSDNFSTEEMEIVGFVGNKWKGGREALENSQELKAKTAEKEVRSLDSVVTDVSKVNAKEDDVERMELSPLEQTPDDPGVPLYKRLYDWIRKREPKLTNLKIDIELNEKRRQRFHLFRSQKKEEQIKKDVIEECFVPLTKEEESEISRALSNNNRRKLLVSHENSNIDITGEGLQCLRPAAWLNDEVINLYLALLKEREKREPNKFLKCHFFNSFFYKKLMGRSGYNFQSVRKWTLQRKLGYSLLDCDKIFVPIHKEVHWCLAVINKKDEKFQYLDSLKGIDAQVLNALARYFVDEVKDKCGTDINVSSWEKEYVTDLPEQANGFDCGMFMLKYVDFYSRDIGLCFGQVEKLLAYAFNKSVVAY